MGVGCGSSAAMAFVVERWLVGVWGKGKGSVSDATAAFSGSFGSCGPEESPSAGTGWLLALSFSSVDSLLTANPTWCWFFLCRRSAMVSGPVPAADAAFPIASFRMSEEPSTPTEIVLFSPW